MPPKVNESMQYRENRLETFQNGSFQYKSKQKRYWTHSVPDIVQLVDCGFYFTPTKINNDQITCVCCRKKETNVEGVTNIADYHLTNNPLCPLALIISSQINHLSNNIQDFWRHQPPKFSNPLSKESIDLRKKTFGKYWKFDQNKASTTTSTTLAKAGFYYCPLRYGNDRVQCVYCNCSLDTWLPDDVPIEEHKNNSNGLCYFLETVNQFKPRSRSNSKSLQDPEVKQAVEKTESNLNINEGHKTKTAESSNENLTNLFNDDSMFNDSEDTNISSAPSREKIPNDSPKKISKTSSYKSKYKSNSKEETTILEGENENYSDDYQDNNVSIDGLVDISSGRMTRSKRRVLARKSKQSSHMLQDRNEEISTRDNNSDSIAYDQKEEFARNQEYIHQNSSLLEEDGEEKVEEKVEEEVEEEKNEELEMTNSDNENDASIDSDIAYNSENVDWNKADEIKNGKLTLTKNNVKSNFSKERSDNDKEFTKPEFTNGRNSSELQNDIQPHQKLARNERKVLETKNIDDMSNDDDDHNDNSNTKDEYRVGSDGQSEFDDDSYNESETDSSDSSIRSLRVKKIEIKRRKNHKRKSQRNNIEDESISSRTRRARRSNRPPKQKVETNELKRDSDATLNSVDEDGSSNLNSSFQTENSDDTYYHSSENMEIEVSGEGPQKISEIATNERLEKRSRKELIDNVSFDDERFKQVLESPRKAKKLKITDKRYSPSPPIYDLSNQNIGDYEEDNIQFLENDIRPSIRNVSTKAPIIKTEKAIEKALSISPMVSKLNSGSQRKSNSKRSKQFTKSLRPNKSKKNNNNILDMSYDDSSNDIFDNDSKPFTFDIRNPLSKPSKNDLSENNKEITGAITADQESEIDLTKDEVANSPVDNVLPSDISVSSDIQNEVISKVHDENVIEPLKVPDSSKEIQNISKFETKKELGSHQIEDISPNKVEDGIEDANMDVDHVVTDKISLLVNIVDPIIDLNKSPEKGHRSIEDDSVILSDKPDIPTAVSKSSKLLTDDSPIKYNEESRVVKHPQENVKQSLEYAYQSTYNEEEPNGNDKSKSNEPSQMEKLYAVKASPSTNEIERNVTSPKVNGLQQESRNERLGSNSAYDDYIQDMKEISNEVKSSKVFSSPVRVSTKSEQNDNSKETLKVSDDTQIPVKQEVSLFLTGKEEAPLAFAPISDDDKLDNDKIAVNEVSKPFNPHISQNAIDRFSGNFSNLLESSTPEKKERTDLLSSTKVPQGPPRWIPVSLSSLLDNLQNMEAASEYLNKSLNSKYDLHDDYDGELTNLISSMPEDEENMTIQEWVKHNATNCHKLAKQTCDEMIEVYRVEYLRAIKTLEQLPTSD